MAIVQVERIEIEDCYLLVDKLNEMLGFAPSSELPQRGSCRVAQINRPNRPRSDVAVLQWSGNRYEQLWVEMLGPTSVDRLYWLIKAWIAGFEAAGRARENNGIVGLQLPDEPNPWRQVDEMNMGRIWPSKVGRPRKDETR